MKLSASVLVSLSLALGLAACADKKEEPKKADFVLPFNQPDSKKLTTQQKADFEQLAAMKSPTTVTDAILKPVGESDEAQTKRLAKRKQAAPALRDWMDRVELNCAIKQPSRSRTQSDGAPRAGWTMNETDVASVNGDRCPMTYDETKSNRYEVLAIAGQNVQKMRFTVDQNQTARAAKNGPGAEDLQIMETTLFSHMTGVVNMSNSKTTSGDFEGSMQATSKLRNGETATMRAIYRMAQRTESLSEMIIILRIEYRGTEYVISARMLNENGSEIRREMFLNGETYTGTGFTVDGH